MWYGGWAFGGRRFDGSLVLFVLGFAAFLDFVRQRPLVPLVALSAMLFAWNAGLMRQAARAEIEPDANVSFRQVAVRSLDVYYQRLGFAGAWPANWLFAWRHGVPAEKFDRLFGHRGFGNFRLPMDAGADAFLGRGFGGVERDERGDWFRWSLGNEATVLVPLREPHRYHLSIRVRPYEAIGENGIGLWVNGRVDRGFDLDPLEGTQDLVWDLEPGRFVEGINEIRFDIQRARRPGEETASPDSRPIGVRFYRLELIARGASPDTTDLDVR
jgi:hypothetical protein